MLTNLILKVLEICECRMILKGTLSNESQQQNIPLGKFINIVTLQHQASAAIRFRGF